VILRRFVDHGHIVAYRVAHFVGRRGFDEALKSAAHGGTVVSKKESGPMLAGHREGRSYYGSLPKTIRKCGFFRIENELRASGSGSNAANRQAKELPAVHSGLITP
jgi:hypothetical protein